MKILFTTALIALMMFVLINNITAQESTQKIHPALRVVLLNASSNDIIDVYATLNEQYPYNPLIEQTFSLNRKERQKEVVRILKEFADTKQQAVRQEDHQPNTGLVRREGDARPGPEARRRQRVVAPKGQNLIRPVGQALEDRIG